LGARIIEFSILELPYVKKSGGSTYFSRYPQIVQRRWCTVSTNVTLSVSREAVKLVRAALLSWSRKEAREG